MIRLLVGLLLLAHGGIHLLGVAKAWNLAPVGELAQPVSRTWGVVWAAAALLLVGAGASRLVNASWWWMLAAPALVVSQVAIVAFWTDARFGTIANLVLLVPVLLGFGSWRFERQVQADVAALAGTSAPSSVVVRDEDVAGLPEPVRRWLKRSGIVGRPRTRTVQLSQQGDMQTGKGNDWMQFRARQWFNVAEPGFVWAAEVDGPYATSLTGRDQYLDGRGAMRIALFALIPLVDARGPKIDQGAAVRYLAETMWFPSAALAPYIRWTPIDDRSAQATLTHEGTEVSGVFRFDRDGNVVGFQARRYRDNQLEDWIIDNDPLSVKTMDGVRVPTRSTITWRDRAGQPWTWLRLELRSLRRGSGASVKSAGGWAMEAQRAWL